MKRILLVIPLLLVIACTSTRPDGYLSRGDISVRIVDHPGLAGQWHRDTLTVDLCYNRPRSTLAHELCHAADSMGLPLQTILARMANLTDQLGPEYTLAVEVAQKASTLRGSDTHWRALRDICGSWAVGHHEILQRIKP